MRKCININLSEQLKKLRKTKKVWQEKLANYLNISFQAVSKWENGNTYPDISLLPDIARFFDVTIDELLQVEQLDKKKMYEECEREAEALYRNGKISEVLLLWEDLYKKLPNSFEVKEMLMSAYYDTDKIKYFNEIVELAINIYNNDESMYNKGQAIRLLANTYADNGNQEMAIKWAAKSIPLFNAKEIIMFQISEKEEMLDYAKFNTYWFLDYLYYMAVKIVYMDSVPRDLQYKQDTFMMVSKIYEIVYQNDDASFETLKELYVMHAKIAQMEINLKNDETKVKFHLSRALECALKSTNIQEHILSTPLIDKMKIKNSPENNYQIIELMKKFISIDDFNSYRNYNWFKEINTKLNIKD